MGCCEQVFMCSMKLQAPDICLAGRVVWSGHVQAPGHVKAVGATAEASFMLPADQKPLLHIVCNKADLKLTSGLTPDEYLRRLLQDDGNANLNISRQVRVARTLLPTCPPPAPQHPRPSH
jgi:hypothetical protein